MKKILFLFAFFFFCVVHAQPPSRFYTTFGGDGDDIAYSAKPTLDHNYIIAGSSSSYGTHGNTDLYLLKLDSMGVFMWQKFIGGFGNDAGKSIIQVADSGYVIAGYTNSFGNGGYDAYLVKTDKYGNVVWQTTFGGLDWDFANDLVLSPDGNIVIVGYTSSFGNGKKDGFVAKYDLGGILLWQKFMGGVENEELRAVIKTNDNFLATVGYTESKNDINGDGYFIKLNDNGDTLFTRTFGGPYKDYANDLIQKNTDDYVMCGAKTYTANGKTHSYMYTASSTGAFVVDSSRYASTGDEEYVSATQPKNLPAISAFVRNVPVPGYKIQGNLYAVNTIGYEYAINSFGGIEDEDFHSIEGTPDGGYVLTGSTQSFGAKQLDVFFLKIMDEVVVTYSSIVGIKKNISVTRPTISYNMETVTVSLPQGANAKTINVYDISGRLIINIPVQQQETTINISELPHSVYLLKVNYEDGSFHTNKLIR